MRIFLLVGLCIAISFTLPAQQGVQTGRSGSPGGQPVVTAETEVRRVFTTVGGRLEPYSRIVYKSPQAGLVDAIYVRHGQQIEAGTPLFSVIQDERAEQYRPFIVEARADGTVSEVLIDLYEDVDPGASAVVALNTDRLSLEAAVSDLDAFSIREGIGVVGVNPAGESFRGTLTHISAEPDYQTGLFTLSFLFPGEGRARIGMSLFIDLPVEEVRGVFVEPEAIVRRYGRNRIWTVDDEQVIASRVVETGSVIGNKILILSGLNPGDRYLRAPTGNEKEGQALSEILSGGRRGNNG